MTVARSGRTAIRAYTGDSGDVALLAGWLAAVARTRIPAITSQPYELQVMARKV